MHRTVTLLSRGYLPTRLIAVDTTGEDDDYKVSAYAYFPTHSLLRLLSYALATVPRTRYELSGTDLPPALLPGARSSTPRLGR
eukprot:3238648-Rhodomonas_salina.1